MRKSTVVSIVFFCLCYALCISLFSALIPKSDTRLTKRDFLANRPKTFSLVAIGDSLTEGVGDVTKQGGYVPLLARSLDVTYGYRTKAVNYGVSGNTSQQILKRMQTNKDLSEDLKKADVMVLTVGGNDVMAVIRKNLAQLKPSSFKKPQKSYQKRLRQIINLARQENKDLPIYILGIYNPFYLNFPEITQMQEVVDGWNLATEAVTEAYEGVYFVPINDLLYRGINGEEGVVQISGEHTTIVNDALFAEDNFHPNNIGYQLMAEAVMEKMHETKKN